MEFDRAWYEDLETFPDLSVDRADERSFVLVASLHLFCISNDRPLLHEIVELKFDQLDYIFISVLW